MTLSLWWTATALALLGGAVAVAVRGVVWPAWKRPERILRRRLRR